MKGYTMFKLVVIIGIIVGFSALGILMTKSYDAMTKQTQYCVVVDTLNTGITNYITRYREVPTVSELQEYMGGGKLLVNPYTNHSIFADAGSAVIGGWNIDQYGHIQSTVECEVME